MKNKIFGGMAVLIIATVAMFNMNIGLKSSKLSDISLANVEALALDEDPIQPKCPDPYDVPDHYIIVTTTSLTTTTNAKGEISFKDIVKGGYEKNKTVAVIICEYNCDGVQSGSCCKQSDVRVDIY